MTTPVSCLRAIPLPLLAAALAAQPQIEITREVYPADPVTAHGDEVWQTYRAIDGITGAPIPNAELLLIDERRAPIRGEFWFRHRAIGDADGFVRIRTDDKNWLVLRAPGYGPSMSMNVLDEVTVPLAPAQDVPVRVLDWRNRPITGALVGFCCGCGHTPDLAHATTDANGLAVLRGIDLFNGIRDLYVEHPDCDMGYESFRWFPGDPPARFRPGRGRPVSGVLLGPKGKPAPGVPIGFPDYHRGPWTRTAEDGSFRLYGLREACDLIAVLPDREVQFDQPPEMPYRLQLPEPNGENVQIVELPPTPLEQLDDDQVLRVELRTEVATGHYTLIGPEPQQNVLRGEIERRVAREYLPPGKYLLRLTCADHRELVRRIEVVAGDDNKFRLQLEALPTVLVEGLEGGLRVALYTEDSARDITEQVREGRPVGIDEQEPVWFVLWGPHDRNRVVAFEPGEALLRTKLQLRWYEPTVLRGRLVDATGALVPGRVAVVPVGDCVDGFDLRALETIAPTDGRLALPTGEVGLALLAILPDDPALAPRVLPVSFPERGDGRELRLGDVVLSPTPRLTVTGGDHAIFLRAGWPLREEPPSFPIDRGRWLGPDPRAGDALLVPGGANEDESIVDLPFRAVLEGDGPWSVRPPRGQLGVDVRSPEGGAVKACVLVGDQAVEVEGPVLLRRVPTGRQRIFVAAEGRQSAIAELEVLPDAPARLEVVLPTR